jgi:uncharacterized protein (DUF2235 family)
VKNTRDQTKHGSQFLNSVETTRHALALNENRRCFTSHVYGAADPTRPTRIRNVVEAWFTGSHADLGGGSARDGLSLYPFQWILAETRAKGLALDENPQERNAAIKEDPLNLAFPLTGDQSGPEGPKRVKPWTIQYTNGIEVDFTDLRISHRHGNMKTGKAKGPPTKRSKSPSLTVTEKTASTDKKKSSSFKSFFSRKKSSQTLSPTALGDEEELVTPQQRSHPVQINAAPAMRSLQKAERSIFTDGKLAGFLDEGWSHMLRNHLLGC